MGLPPLRPQHAGLLRGLDLIASAALGRLQAGLTARQSRRIEAVPPLLRAAVLVPLLSRDDGVSILFTRRTDTVLSHKGQISFPGGQREPSDGSAVETALRESYEEIGIEPSAVTVLGDLDDVFTSVSGYVVTPVVGLVNTTLDRLTLAPAEVKSVFVVPVDKLADPDVHTTRTRMVDGRSFRIHYYSVGEDVIWGATGFMVHEFLQAWERATGSDVSRSRS